MTNEAPGFEVEAASVEEFLRLLREREGDEAAQGVPSSPLLRAVFVARLQEVRRSRYPFPKVVRRVVAAFAHGADVVCLRRITSSAVELPEMARTFEEGQRAVYEELRAEVERGLGEADLGIPLYEGSLCRSVERDGDR